jgi:preprotein translocase subunit SecY
MFLMWLGEQISQRGIGNGISFIIFTGIVSGLPVTFASILELTKTGAMSSFTLILIFTVVFLLIYFIVFIERAQRKISVQYPKRQVGNKIFEGQSTHLPLKINTAGVITAIFANSLLLFPLTISNFMSTDGGTSFLIVVSVVLDTFSQIQSSLFTYQYESLMKKARFRR